MSSLIKKYLVPLAMLILILLVVFWCRRPRCLLQDIDQIDVRTSAEDAAEEIQEDEQLKTILQTCRFRLHPLAKTVWQWEDGTCDLLIDTDDHSESWELVLLPESGVYRLINSNHSWMVYDLVDSEKAEEILALQKE